MRAVAAGYEKPGKRRGLVEKNSAHFLPHLVVRLPDSRPDPGNEAPGRKMRRHRFQHPAGEPAPAGVRYRHSGTVAGGKSHGQAVGSEHGKRQVRPGRHRRIGLRRRSLPGLAIGIEDARAVHLLEPQRHGGKEPREAQAILRHRRGVVAHVRGEVEGGIRLTAHPALAVGEAQYYVARCFRPMNAADHRFSPRRISSSRVMSSGRGDSQRHGSPLAGCTRASRRACSA